MDNREKQSEAVEKDLRIKELELQVEELNDFIENATLSLHWVNGSGIIIWANKFELDMLGYSREEYIGKHINNFHADKAAIEEILSRLIRKESLVNQPANLLCKNGEVKPVVMNSSAYFKGDKFIHTRCFTRDISEQKKEEAKNAGLLLELQKKNNLLKSELDKLRSVAQ
jgi:two-component system sensor histidine kinase VicK